MKITDDMVRSHYGDGSGMTPNTPEEDRRAIQVLQEAAELMRQKGKAYNNVPQADYYPHGILSIWTMMHQKMTRIKSLMDNPNAENSFEGIDDSARDLINYTAFLVEYLEGRMDGQ